MQKNKIIIIMEMRKLQVVFTSDIRKGNQSISVTLSVAWSLLPDRQI